MKIKILIRLFLCSFVLLFTQLGFGATSSSGEQTFSQDRSSQFSSKDRTFLMEAAQGGMAEVEMARNGIEMGQNEAVKNLSRRLLADHSRMNDELRQLAANKSLNLPTEPTSDQTAMMDTLAKLNGTEFDKAFVAHMTQDHQKDIAKFEEAARNADDADVRAFAEKQLPTLRAHLNMANSVHLSMR
jgi:putative membrane protein